MRALPFLGLSFAVLVGLWMLPGCESALGYGDLKFGEDAGEEGNKGGSGGETDSSAGGASSGGTSTGGTSAGGTSAGGTSAGGTSAGGTSAGGTSAGGTSTGGTSTGGTSAGGASTGGSGGTTDPYAAARQICIDHINELRATKGLAPYARWTEIETCVDKQATYDEQHNSPHAASSQNIYPECGGTPQNECLGQGVSGIASCLDMMWAEKDQAGCAGCDACDLYTIYGGGCKDCDFNGSVVCGHYVNMSAKQLSGAACGFSALGGWDAIDFH